MKKLFTLLLVVLSVWGYAQTFQLTNTAGNIYTNEHTISHVITEEDLNASEFVVDIIVKNLTSSELEVNTRRENIALVDSMQAYVCFYVCDSPEGTMFEMNHVIEGDSSELYSLHVVIPDNTFGLSKFKLEFWTDAEQADKMTLYVEIDMTRLAIKEQSQTNVSLSAFPNPASANSKINVSYTLADKNDNPHLVIKNVLGATVINIPLNPHGNHASIDISNLKSGVYIYAIENRNQIIIARKLIVK